MLALIAGRGGLPSAVASAQEVKPLVCAMEGFEPDGLVPDLTFRLETLGTLLLTLGEQGVTDVCLCGTITRPKVDPAKLDVETLPLVPIFAKALQKGDDGALRVVMQIFEQKGFTVRGAHELLPELIRPKCVPTVVQPAPYHELDALEGERVLAEMGASDLGQACVVRHGKVFAREQLAGTDAMLGAFAEKYVSHSGAPGTFDQALSSVDWLSAPVSKIVDVIDNWIEGLAVAEAGPKPAAAGVLFKAPKPGQDRRADLPTIGPKTALMAAQAGLAGIIIEADGVIVIQEDQIVRILDAVGMFLWVR